MAYNLSRKRRVVGIINRNSEVVLISIHDYYLTEGLDKQLQAIEMGYVND